MLVILTLSVVEGEEPPHFAFAVAVVPALLGRERPSAVSRVVCQF